MTCTPDARFVYKKLTNADRIKKLKDQLKHEVDEHDVATVTICIFFKYKYR